METVVLITGLAIVANLTICMAMERTVVPPMAGYLLLGLAIRLCDGKWNFLNGESLDVFQFLADIGIIVLLFRVGLESDIQGLLKQLPKASAIWVGDVVVSGATGFVVAFYLLSLNLATSLIVATAFTATSVGISVAIWQNRNALDSSSGRLLIDVAEMDDISAVVLMALLFALLPLFRNASGMMEMLPAILKTIGLFSVKFAAFVALCLFFSIFLEKPITKFFRNKAPRPQPMLLVTGIGIVVAAVAGLLGFSFAIGAFFAGLVFSRDPDTVNMEANFLPIYGLFSPFFFVGIGLDLDPETLAGAFFPGAVLFAAAVLGKLAADGVPVWIMSDWKSALLIGASMTPRAEISMIVMQRGLELGDWAVGQKIYGAMIFMCMLSCLLSPFVVDGLLRRWGKQQE